MQVDVVMVLAEGLTSCSMLHLTMHLITSTLRITQCSCYWNSGQILCVPQITLEYGTLISSFYKGKQMYANIMTL